MQPHEYEKMFDAEDRYFWFVGKHRLVRAVLDEALCGVEDPLILDVGCGTGGLLESLSALGRAAGVDEDALALSFCRRRGMSLLSRMDWSRPAIAPESFDAVVASDFIEHLDDDVAALRSMCHALKPGGKMVVTVPAMPWMWSPHDVALGHKRRYTRRALRRALDDAGFVHGRTFFFMAAIMPILVPVRIFLKIGRSIAGGSSETHERTEDTVSYKMPGPVNRMMLRLIDAEREWIMRGNDPKIGSTLVALAIKRDK